MTMLNRMTVFFYNRYRAYQRRQVTLDPAVLQSLPSSASTLERRSRTTVLRDKTTRVLTASVVAVGIFAAGGAYEHHQQYAAHQATLEN